MKQKALALLLTGILLLSLTGCSKPEDEVIKAIDAIGTVTMDSLELIEYAEDLYAQLETSEKVNVTNKTVLSKARTEYNRQKKLIETASDAIDAIGTITISSDAAVAAAREAYDAAAEYDTLGTLNGKEKVLLSAEKELKALKDEINSLADKMMELYEAGRYSELVSTANPYIQELPEGELRTLLGTYVVEALCAQSQEEYDSGDCMAAMKTIGRRKNFAVCCDPEILALAEDIENGYIKAMARNAPANGTILERTYDAGRNHYTITAGSSDTVVKMQLVDDPSKFVTVYIKANNAVKINLLNGTYIVKYTTGPIWYGKEDMFGPDATYITLNGSLTFAGYTGGGYIHWQYGSHTLTSGYGDNLGAQNMDPDDF